MDELRLIVDFKTGQWQDDPKMSQYLQPSTLFGSKADGYLQAAWQAKENPPTTEANDSQAGIPNNTKSKAHYSPSVPPLFLLCWLQSLAPSSVMYACIPSFSEKLNLCKYSLLRIHHAGWNTH